MPEWAAVERFHGDLARFLAQPWPFECPPGKLQPADNTQHAHRSSGLPNRSHGHRTMSSGCQGRRWTSILLRSASWAAWSLATRSRTWRLSAPLELPGMRISTLPLSRAITGFGTEEQEDAAILKAKNGDPSL